MKIVGLQKLTLLDFPGKVACTVFLGGCNFRCPFCHNSDLLDGTAEALMDDGAFLEFLKKRKGLLDAVCVSGGEPTLQSALPQFLKSIKDLGFLVKLDTNGYRPEVLRSLVESGLVDYVAMDVKNGPSHYATTTGHPGIDLDRLAQSLRFLIEGNIPYELRTTVVEELHSEGSVLEMGQWLAALAAPKKPQRLFLQCFTDRDSVLLAGLHAPRKETLEKYVEILTPYVGEIALRGV